MALGAQLVVVSNGAARGRGQNWQQIKYFEQKQMIFCYNCIIVNDNQKDATILVYLFIPNQLYMFRAMSSPIIRSS